jgi:hypothetical protein
MEKVYIMIQIWDYLKDFSKMILNKVKALKSYKIKQYIKETL